MKKELCTNRKNYKGSYRNGRLSSESQKRVKDRQLKDRQPKTIKKTVYQIAYRKAHKKEAKAYREAHKKETEAYREAHAEEIKAQTKVYREANKEKRNASSRAYDKANKKERNAQHRAWYQTHKEEAKAYSRAWHKANPKKAKARNRVYREAHPEKYREVGRKRRALKYKTRTELINEKRVFLRDGWICQICQKPVNKKLRWPHPMSPSMDHIIPLDKKGTHTYGNVQLTHLFCNISKGTKVLPQKENILSEAKGRDAK